MVFKWKSAQMLLLPWHVNSPRQDAVMRLILWLIQHEVITDEKIKQNISLTQSCKTFDIFSIKWHLVLLTDAVHSDGAGW